MDETELAAALLLRADLSAETGSEDAITLTTISRAASAPKKIVVSLLKNLPATYSSLLPANAGTLTDRALLLCTGTGDDRTLLIVSADGSCLMEAAMLLVDDTRVSQETTSLTYVAKDASQLMRDALAYSDNNATYTLSNLAGGGLSYVGPFHQEKTIFLPFSGGYVLSGTGTMLCDGVEESLTPGMCHYCAQGHTHKLMNTGTEPLTVFAVVPEHKK